MTTEELYEHHSNKRDSHSKMVLDSSHPMKLVMAGPGTGKSHLFKQLAAKYIAAGKSNIIVLSFINDLVNDLRVDLRGLAEVSTLHSFAAKKLHRSNKHIDMDLLAVIQRDYEIETGLTKDLPKIFHELQSGEDEVHAYVKRRRSYYSCYDPASMVYDLVEVFSADHDTIPRYDLVLVDEYQDFNKLEIELINLLALKSDVLIAGDDDQSLYSFKHADPAHIRALSLSDEWEFFELPYCSRSTRVVIDAFHDFVGAAIAEGCLAGRTSKQYVYFPCVDKDQVSAAHPHVEVVTSIYQTQIAYYLDSHIKTIFEKDAKFDVLVVCSLKSQIPALARALRKLGYANVHSDATSSDISEELANGLKYIVSDKDSNFGWRLCSEALVTGEQLGEIVGGTSGCDVAFSDAVPTEVRKLVRGLRAACVKLNDGKPLGTEQREVLFSKLGISPSELAETEARDQIFRSYKKNPCGDIKIKMTTILKSKGLSYDYVFLVNFDDKYLIPKGGVTDESLHKFLVALTRSRKRISIFSSQADGPIFAKWIGSARKRVTVVGH